MCAGDTARRSTEFLGVPSGCVLPDLRIGGQTQSGGERGGGGGRKKESENINWKPTRAVRPELSVSCSINSRLAVPEKFDS